MHWKKYAILLPPFVLIGLLLLNYLPTGQKHYAILVALVFWVFYYVWVYIDRKRKDDIEKSSVNGINK
jgi:uncharacterized membrane protein YfcA